MSKWWVKKVVVMQNTPQLSRNNEIKFERQWEKIFSQIISWEDEVKFLKRFWLIGPLAIWVFQDTNASLFESRTIIPQQVQMKEDTNYQLPLFSVSIMQWDTFDSIIKRKWIPLKFKDKIVDFNKLYKSDFNEAHLKVWELVMIPFWKTGFYTDGITDEIPKPEPVKPNTPNVSKPLRSTNPSVLVNPWRRVEVQEWKFDFDHWVNSVEVIWNQLKGKVFILDPWHGGLDLWAHPIARDANGNPIMDQDSWVFVRNINNMWANDRRSNWQWSWFLHVYESLVTVDITYRLAKKIKEQWWEVRITRYNRTTGISQASSPTTPHQDDDVFSDDKESWSRKGRAWYRINRWIQIANSIQDSFLSKWVNKNNIFFLSIHADADGRNVTDNPMRFLYYDGKMWLAQEAKNYAERLAWLDFRMKKTEIRRGDAKIVNPNYNKIQNAVLVEVANMQNSASAYLLRQPTWRQRYADTLYESIIKSIK